MIWSIILGLLMICYITLYSITKKSYKQECEGLSKQDCKQIMLLSMGLFLVDHLPKLNMQQTNQSILLLYGKQQYAWRLRYYHAQRLAILMLVLFITLCVAWILNLKSLGVSTLTDIQRPAFGEGEQIKRYYYELNISEKNKSNKISKDILLTIPEKLPTKEERKNELERIKKDLPSLILGENKTLEHVDHPLNLTKALSENVQILWTSQNEELLQNDGQIRYNNLMHEGERVIINGVIQCYGEDDQVEYEVKLFKKTLDVQEKQKQVKERIDLMLSHKALSKSSEGKITLPQNFSDYDTSLRWYNGEKKVANISLLLGGICLGVVFFMIKCYELKTKVQSRKEALLKAFPGFVNKVALLMNAGMTFSRAWEKIANDYILVKERGGEKLLLYEEVLVTLEDLHKGDSELTAYEAFGQRCKIPEILRFTAIVMQNIKKGSHLLIEAMQQQSKEAMSMREDLARKKGEKASTKLVLPMGIMFLAILIIVIAPALITLKI